MIQVLGQFFVKNAKIDPITLFVLKIGKIQKSPGKSVKMVFFNLQNTETRSFSRYLLEILYQYTPDRVLSHIFRFWKREKFPHFLKIMFSIIIFYFFSKFSEFWRYEIAVWYKHSFSTIYWKPIPSVIKTVCVRAVPANPHFWIKPGKHDITLTSFIADLSKLTTFPFVRMCKIDGLEGTENLAMILK